MKNSSPYPISVIRRKRQKNLRLRVNGSKVIVSAPWHCSDRVIEEFVGAHTSWIEKALSRQKQNKEAIDEELQRNKRAILMDGKWHPLIYSGASPGGADISFVEQGAMLAWFADKESPFYVDFPLIKKAANTWLKGKANVVLREKIKKIAEEQGFSYARVFIRSQKTKWGTCSSKKNISLNWRVIKTPEWVQKYLIIHELCHTVHLNHSKAYWELVGRHFPERKEAEKWLKTHEAIVFADSELL